MGSVRCPVTIIHGTWDPVCPCEGTTGYLQKMLANAERVEVVGIERGGHNLHLGEAGAVVRRAGRE